MMRKATAVTCALVLLLVVLGGYQPAAAVSTVIVPGKALGPVSLGMSWDDVTRILGQPAPAQGEEVLYPDWDVAVIYRDGNAVRFTTTNPQFRTASGAGVGIPIDDATRLVGSGMLDMSVTNGDPVVLYPSSGIGFVFHLGVAVEVFVVAPGPAGNISLVPAPPGPVRPKTFTLILGPPPPSPPVSPAKESRITSAGARPEVELENVTSTVDAAQGLFRISGEIANVGSTAMDGVTVAATFLKRSGDETRRQAVISQPVAAGESAPFSLETPLLQTIAGGDFIVRYTAEVTARGGGRFALFQTSYAVPPDAYEELARGQVKVDVQFGPPSTTSPQVQVLVSINGSGSIPAAWIRDVLVEIPFSSGARLVQLHPGETVAILITPFVPLALVAGARGIPFGGFFPPPLPPIIVGAPEVLSVALAIP